MEMVSDVDHCFVVAHMPKGLSKQKRMEGAIGSGLLETIDGCVHSLLGGGERASGQHFDSLGIPNCAARIDDLLSGLL